ncbi:hypothetical protein GJW-30_1_00759 [Variibacter gotjawalensis]|uniref:Smr domain-containing protein n=1 Tax=Variibacter gotjawalensis TaxID=1333996 RepID=A0A0S3PQT4_9BRAD|nr:Smr/MutS family protein [Variibacter gotjawalensis]NIK48537.1 DNA-nicking Smr family endonuclease [Variibacter gotjawalensis]RZS50402.1 DNA-nicking Smr family endonuclease [Variibacter gotjawalensis]BAT58236.1 hypothetical protein GJW-30_1_00759 [Variibacter gotjawalensis]
MTRKRNLSGEERALWRAVTREIKPLRAMIERIEEQIAPPPAPPKAIPKRMVVAPKPPSPPPVAKTPALAPLDRRAKQRVARGHTDIDARIDLHGMTQERAHSALLRFIRNAQGDDLRLLLVITGKGARDGERGVLRRVVPQWLALPDMRSYVVGFETASIRHGGEGALYVRVRRQK